MPCPEVYECISTCLCHWSYYENIDKLIIALFLCWGRTCLYLVQQVKLIFWSLLAFVTPFSLPIMFLHWTRKMPERYCNRLVCFNLRISIQLLKHYIIKF